MAFCFIRLELYDEAIDTLTAALARDIRSAAIYSDLGWLLCDARHDYDTAIDLLNDGYQKFREDIFVVNNLAYAHLMKGHAEPARSILEASAYLLKPNENVRSEKLVALLATWGLLYIVDGDFEAGQDYTKAQKLAGQINDQSLAATVSQKMHLELARAAVRLRDFSLARRHIRMGLAIRRGRPLYHVDLDKLDEELRLK